MQLNDPLSLTSAHNQPRTGLEPKIIVQLQINHTCCLNKILNHLHNLEREREKYLIRVNSSHNQTRIKTMKARSWSS